MTRVEGREVPGSAVDSVGSEPQAPVHPRSQVRAADVTPPPSLSSEAGQITESGSSAKG